MSATVPIQSTAGAVAVMNAKGEISMEKVKVARHRRYVDPANTKNATRDSESEEDEIENFYLTSEALNSSTGITLEASGTDRRLQRLQSNTVATRTRVLVEASVDDEAKGSRARPSRHVASSDEDEEASEEDDAPVRDRSREEFIDGDVEEEDAGAIAARRRRAVELARIKATAEAEEMAIEAEEDVFEGAEDEEDSEYESYTDDSDTENAPLHKPVFVSKNERTLIKEREAASKRELEKDKQAQQQFEARVQASRHLVSEIVQEELNHEMEAKIKIEDDDGDDEEEFNLWKIRELNRIKRNRDERDAMEKERVEVERLREMTEDERLMVLRSREKIITNKQVRGKMNFMQKYYHRGAFYLDEESDLLKRNIMEPTLEDHFDKLVMPKVMQVKNFGRHGQTKYTHLKDQDTSKPDAAWDTSVNVRIENKRGGAKQDFERPSMSKRKR